MSNQQDQWKNWDEERHYGEVFYRRATGLSPEMESSKSVSRVIKKFYQQGDSLLDVGCGAGHYLRSLRRIVDPNLRYHGVDPTAYYLQLAKKAWKDAATFRQGSIFDIPEADQSHDIVMCNNVVMHLPPEKIKRAFDELFRVARKSVVVRAMFGERNYLIREVLLPKDLDPNAPQSYDYGDFDLTETPFRHFNMYTEDFFQNLLNTYGAKEVQIFRDQDWGNFDNTGDTQINTATKTLGEMQVSGNLILDWRYILLHR